MGLQPLLVKADSPDAHFIGKMMSERIYQRARWTNPHDDTHTGLEWGGLLARYIGRVVEAALTENRELYRKALVVVASVAMAAWEADFRKSEPFTHQGCAPAEGAPFERANDEGPAGS